MVSYQYTGRVDKNICNSCMGKRTRSFIGCSTSWRRKVKSIGGGGGGAQPLGVGRLRVLRGGMVHPKR